MTAWIRMVTDDDASEELRRQLDKARAPNGSVDNVMRVHSLRPHTMEGHHVLYMSVLAQRGNTLPDWLLETVASYTSILNRCDYSLGESLCQRASPHRRRRTRGPDPRGLARRPARDRFLG